MNSIETRKTKWKEIAMLCIWSAFAFFHVELGYLERNVAALGLY